MAGISRADIWYPFFVAAAIAFIIFGGFRGRAFVFCTALTLALSNGLAVHPLKQAIGRPRPKQTEAVRLVELQKARPMILTLLKKPEIRYSNAADRARSGASFPSGHTNNNTIIALCCTLFYRRRGALYWPVALAVMYSRIYLGAHWPSDVAGTFFLGIGETLLVLGLCELVWKFIVARRWPRIAAQHPTILPSHA